MHACCIFTIEKMYKMAEKDKLKISIKIQFPS